LDQRPQIGTRHSRPGFSHGDKFGLKRYLHDLITRLSRKDRASVSYVNRWLA